MRLDDLFVLFNENSLSLKDLRQVRTLYYAYQVYKYLIYIPLLALSTVVLTLLSIPIIRILGQSAGQISGIIWARFNSLIAPMYVTVEGRENIERGRSYIVVANHQSGFDIFAVYGWLPVNFRWVMKAELRKVPFLGYYCEKAGHILIDRSDKRSAVESINKAINRISGGISIMFFPEGTRSVTGELLEFKKGAFIFALETGLPVLPVTITGTKDILPSNTMSLFPGNARMIIHKPVDISSYDESSIDSLIEQVRNTIRKDIVI